MKILACDYDGTLNRGGGVTSEDIAAIQRWQAEGNLFGVDSGRDWESLMSVWRGVPIPIDFLIGGNGTQIYTKSGQRILQYTCDGTLVPEICDMIFDYKGYYSYFANDEGKYIASPNGNFPERCSEIKFSRGEIPKLSVVRTISTYFDSEEQSLLFCRDFNCKYGKIFEACNNTGCADMMPIGISKSSGLSAYIKHERLEPEIVLTAGDSGNDLAMLLDFYGYVPESASEHIKKAVGRTVPDIKTIVEKHI